MPTGTDLSVDQRDCVYHACYIEKLSPESIVTKYFTTYNGSIIVSLRTVQNLCALFLSDNHQQISAYLAGPVGHKGGDHGGRPRVTTSQERYYITQMFRNNNTIRGTEVYSRLQNSLYCTVA